MTMDLQSELAGIVDALAGGQVPYALCGGLAVALHGYPRFTKDIDLLVPAEHVDRIKALVAPLGFSLEAEPMTFGIGTTSERIVHRLSKIRDGEVLTLDLLLLSPVLSDVWTERQAFEWEGRRLSVVSAAGLARMKRLAGRRQDLLDLEQLGFLPPGDDPGG